MRGWPRRWSVALVIIAIWQRYVTGSRWWLALLCAVLVLDVFVAGWITSLWLPYLKEAW